MNAKSDYVELQTERLTMRRLTLDDAEEWSTFFEDNPNLLYLGLISSNETKDYTNLDWAKKWINIQLERYKLSGFGMLALISKETGKLIGQAGILKKELDGKTEYEIAYSLIPKYWRKGLASEISAELVSYAIENRIHHRIISIIHVDNIGSQKVARNNNMSVLFETIYAEMNVSVYGRNIELD